MKKQFTTVILGLVLLLLIPFVSYAFGFGGLGGSKPFGGKAIYSLPCNDGFLVYITPAGGSPSSLLFPYGVKTYSHNVFPPVASTWVLGMAESNQSACVIGSPPTSVILGYGNKVKYYGSSL